MASQEPETVDSLKSRYADLCDEDETPGELADFDGFQEAAPPQISEDEPIISMETSDVLDHDGTWFRANVQSKRIRNRSSSGTVNSGSDDPESAETTRPKKKRQPHASLFTNKTAMSSGLQTTVLIAQEDMDRDSLLGASSKPMSHDPLAISKSLTSMNLDQLQVKDVRINRRRNLVAVEFKNSECAGIALLLEQQTFGPFAVKCYRPAVDSKDVCWGVIGPVHLDVGLDDLFSEIHCEDFQVLHVFRLSKFSTGRKEDSLSIKIGFSGTVLPQNVKVGFMSFPVRAFNEPPLRCYRCQRPGHMASGCTAPRRCVICGGDHRKEDCMATAPRCANCRGPHSASSKDCSFNQDAKRVQQLVKQGMTYRSAARRVTRDRQEIQVAPPFAESPRHFSVSQANTSPQEITQSTGYRDALTQSAVKSVGPRLVHAAADVHQSQGSYYIPRRYPRVPAATFVATAASPLHSQSVSVPLSPAPVVVAAPAESAPSQSSWEEALLDKCEALISRNLEQILKVWEEKLLSRCESALLNTCEPRLLAVCKEKSFTSVVQQCEQALVDKCENAISATVSSLFTKMSALLVELFSLNFVNEGQHERQLLLIGLIRNHFGPTISEPLLQKQQKVASAALSPTVASGTTSKAVRPVLSSQSQKTKSNSSASSRPARKP